jgi:predicted DsbA family dithiol-disulfide isomerase
MRPVHVDIISDVICPWCYVGKRAFDIAVAARPEIAVTVRFRAYQLDPDVPAHGADRRQRLLEKFGGDAERLKAIGEALKDAAANVGLDLNPDRIERTPNTLDCHRLILWAASAGAQEMMVEALFQAYWREGEDLTCQDTLVAIARGCGLDGPVVRDLLSSEADIGAVRQEIDVARRMGVTGVPCFVFNQTFAVMGAQTPEKFERALGTAAKGAP